MLLLNIHTDRYDTDKDETLQYIEDQIQKRFDKWSRPMDGSFILETSISPEECLEWLNSVWVPNYKAGSAPMARCAPRVSKVLVTRINPTEIVGRLSAETWAALGKISL